MRPDLQWWTDPASGQAFGLVQQGGEALATVYATNHGQELQLWAHDTVATHDLHSFSAAALLPLIARMQGSFILHAGALRLHDTLFAFFSPSGAGKSTTLLLTQQSLPESSVFTDDALAIRPHQTRWIFDAGPARLKVDATTEAFIAHTGLRAQEKVFASSHKRYLDLPTSPMRHHVGPVVFLVVSRATDKEKPSIQPLSGSHSLATLDACRSLPFYRNVHTAKRDLEDLSALLLQPHARVWNLRIPSGLAPAHAWISTHLASWIHAQSQCSPDPTTS